MKRNLSNSPEYMRGYVDGHREQGAIARYVINNPKYLRGYLDGQRKLREERLRQNPRFQALSLILILLTLFGLGHCSASYEQSNPRQTPTEQAQ